MPDGRRRARTIALQALFEIDSVGHSPEKALKSLLEEMSLPEEATTFAKRLVKGVLENKTSLDATIQRFAPTWPVDQLAIVDRNILRLAIFEILFDKEAPLKVVINEAVELAKTFGSESSARFVNGVLGSLCYEGSPQI